MAAPVPLPAAAWSGGPSLLHSALRSVIRSLPLRHCVLRAGCRPCLPASMAGPGGPLPSSVLPALPSSVLLVPLLRSSS
eukprot:6677223-Heterocapsa_arctica.AAC.1